MPVETPIRKTVFRGTFDQLYPTAHDRYGMDDQIGWENIKDLRLGVETKPTKKMGFNVEYNDWYLASATDAMYAGTGAALFRSTTGADGTHIGQELDLMATYAISGTNNGGSGMGPHIPRTVSATGHTRTWVYISVHHGYLEVLRRAKKRQANREEYACRYTKKAIRHSEDCL